MSYTGGRPDTLTPQLSDEQVNSMMMQPSPAMSAPSDSPYQKAEKASGSTPLLAQSHLTSSYAKANNSVGGSNENSVGHSAGQQQHQEGYQSIRDLRSNSDVMEEETEDCCPSCTIG